MRIAKFHGHLLSGDGVAGTLLPVSESALPMVDLWGTGTPRREFLFNLPLKRESGPLTQVISKGLIDGIKKYFNSLFQSL